MTPEEYILLCDQTIAYIKEKRRHSGESGKLLVVRVMLIRSHYVKLAREEAKRAGKGNFQYADKVVQ